MACEVLLSYPRRRVGTTKQTLYQNLQTGQYSSYCYSMIIRGIGYRAYYIKTFVSDNLYEFQYSSYLIVRAGHTADLYQPIPQTINIYVGKKDRKLVVRGRHRSQVSYLAVTIANYRLPSVYTGRGIRIKGLKILRKAGKKDKQKGKAF